MLVRCISTSYAQSTLLLCAEQLIRSMCAQNAQALLDEGSAPLRATLGRLTGNMLGLAGVVRRLSEVVQVGGAEGLGFHAPFAAFLLASDVPGIVH